MKKSDFPLLKATPSAQVGKKVPSKVSSKPSPAVSKVEKPENMANSRIEQLEKDIVALSEELRATNHELGQMQLENQRLRLVERCSECKLTRRVSFSEDVMGPDEDCYSTGEHGYTSDITTIHELKEVCCPPQTHTHTHTHTHTQLSCTPRGDVRGIWPPPVVLVHQREHVTERALGKTIVVTGARSTCASMPLCVFLCVWGRGGTLAGPGMLT